MIYFDNAATTQPFKECLDIFYDVNLHNYYNPSALYSPAFSIFKKINECRDFIINVLNGKEGDKIIFTSGATESNNLAIFGCATNKNKKYLFSMGEHPAVYNCAIELKNRGYKIDFIPLSKNGQIDYDFLENAIDENVAFVSTMFVNNETGAINDLNRIRNIIDKKTKDCIFHVDAVQGFCKLDLNVVKNKIDLCSISAHKIGGIKGVGALYISKNCRIKNINFGGGQEFGLRSGTVNPAGILSFKSAIKIMIENKDTFYNNVFHLKQHFVEKLKSFENKVKLISDENCSPYIVSLIIQNQRGETIMRFLDSKNILIGTGSACSSNKVGNRVLESMGYSKNEVLGAIRISFGVYNKKNEIDFLIQILNEFFEKML